jgi:hypothetical protein
MYVYCIYLGNEIYFGSTKNPLNYRQNKHNFRLKEGICKNKLYEKARELGIKNLELNLLYEGEDYLDIEQELILNTDCLNMLAVKHDRERYLRLHREAQKRYILKKKSQKLNLDIIYKHE